MLPIILNLSEFWIIVLSFELIFVLNTMDEQACYRNKLIDRLFIHIHLVKFHLQLKTSKTKSCQSKVNSSPVHKALSLNLWD